MIFSSTTFNSSTDKVLMDTFLSKLAFSSFTLCLTILIHHITHAITLSILHDDKNLFRIYGTISSSSTLIHYLGSLWLWLWLFLSALKLSCLPGLPNWIHPSNSGIFIQCLTFSWLDGDKPQDVSSARLDFDSIYIHWLTFEFSLINWTLLTTRILNLFQLLLM